MVKHFYKFSPLNSLCQFSNIIYFVHVAFAVLLLCNDIHQNPGPDTSRYESCNLSIVHLNVNSVRHKTDLINTELGNHDIICITESKLDNSVSSDDISIENFLNPAPFRRDRAYDRGGGIIFYIKNNLNVKRRSDLELQDIESVCVECISDNKKILIMCFYRPPNARVSSWDHLDNLFTNCIDSNIDNVILLGDINVDLITISKTHRLSRLFERLGLVNVIKEPTRITPASSNLIDPIFVNNFNIVKDSYVLANFCSDHCPTVIELKFTTPREKSYLKTIFDYDNGDYDAIKQHMQGIDWEDRFLDSLDVNLVNENINGEITYAVHTFIPQKTIRIRPRDKPWIDNNIKCKIRKRNRLHKKAKYRNLASDWQNFRNIRNEVIIMIRDAKKNYIVKLQNSLVDKNIPPGKWWRIAKGVTKFKNVNHVKTPIKSNGDIFYHPIEKACIINDYFASVSNLETEPEWPNVPPLAPCELSEIVVTEREVIDQFETINISKPGGPDNLPPRLLRAIFQPLVKPLTILFNKSLYYGVVPSGWKMANVTAIYKGKGGSDSACNYRPISVTNCFGKMLEKIIFKHLHNYIRDNDILTDNQSGFRHKDSTVNQLLIIYDDIMKNLDIGKDVRFIFCDVSKAFDRVWHSGLLYKLRKYGIKDRLLDWFRSYLSDRKQRVCMDGYCSTWNSINAGVPQGSILGPYLFLLFVNDIVDVVSNKIKLFADDTSLYCIVDNHETAAVSLNTDLDSLHSWSSDWGVTFNSSKTKSMLFTRKQNVNPPTLYLNNDALDNTLIHKHLGLTFNYKGAWKDHINDTYSKACTRLNVLCMLKYNLDRNSLERLYFAFIRPILEYGNIIWDNCTNQESDLIESVQYEAARIVTGMRKGTSRLKLYNELGWDSLKERRKKQKLIFVYKSLGGYLPGNISDYFASFINIGDNYSFRNTRYFNIPRSNTQSYKQSFFPSALELWNNLDQETQNMTSLSAFKRKLNIGLIKPPGHYSAGPRKLNIIYCQLRNEVSNLNDHLYRSHLSESPRCACGGDIENNSHYFYDCPLYVRQRDKLFHDLRELDQILNLEIMLCGSINLSPEENLNIVNSVLQYINETKRFE